MVKQLQDNPVFLRKMHDLAQTQKFETVPRNVQEYWVARMWFYGLLGALDFMGYEVRKKDETN